MEQKILSKVAVEFLQHRERDYTGSSELYRMLSGFVAADRDLLDVASFGTYSMTKPISWRSALFADALQSRNSDNVLSKSAPTNKHGR